MMETLLGLPGWATSPGSNFSTLFLVSKNMAALRSPGRKVIFFWGYSRVTCKIPRSNQRGVLGIRRSTKMCQEKKKMWATCFLFVLPDLNYLKNCSFPTFVILIGSKTLGFCSSIFRAEMFHSVPSIQRALSENTTPGGFHLKRCRPNNQKQLSISQIVPCHKDHGTGDPPTNGRVNEPV